jgi:hypothetical protein
MQTDPPQRHYANNIQSHWGLYDLTFDFGFAPIEGELEPLVSVVMTWEEARVLRRIVSDALDRYEEVVGPVRDLEAAPKAGPAISQNGGGSHFDAESHGADDESEGPDDPDDDSTGE